MAGSGPTGAPSQPESPEAGGVGAVRLCCRTATRTNNPNSTRRKHPPPMIFHHHPANRLKQLGAPYPRRLEFESNANNSGSGRGHNKGREGAGVLPIESLVLPDYKPPPRYEINTVGSKKERKTLSDLPTSTMSLYVQTMQPFVQCIQRA